MKTVSVPHVGSPTVAVSPRQRIPISAIWLFGGALILLVCWSFAVPVFETPDETHHWQFARYLYDSRQLPPYSPAIVEANSPPLYYMLIAPVAASPDEPPLFIWSDGRGQMVQAAPPRIYQNSYSDFRAYWPLRYARLLTALMSVVTVFFCYLVGYEATGRPSTGVLTAGLVALLPQFTFRGMSVSNDALVTTLGAAALYLTVRTLRRGFQWHVALVAAVVIAGAFLTKISAIFLPIPLGFVLLAEQGHWSVRAKRLTIFAVTLILVAPWCYRNYVLYGDLFASNAMLTAVAGIVDRKAITSPFFLTDFPYLLIRSFIGLFGMMNISMSERVYQGYFLLFGVATIGLVWGLVKGRVSRWLAALLVTYPLLNLAIVININLAFTQPQGRYMFIALPAIMLLVALGLESLPHWSPPLHWATLGGLTLANVAILVYFIVFSYWPPAIPTLPSPALPLAQIEPQNVALSQQDTFVINAAQPRFVLPAKIDTTQYAFLRFTIRSSAANPNLRGTIYILGADGTPNLARGATFEWLADGQERVITVPLFQNPDWHGCITGFYIDPVDHGDSDLHVGMTLLLHDIRLTGNLR